MKETKVIMATMLMPRKMHRELKILAAQEESSMTKLILEGIEWVLKQRGIKVIKN
jgi:hypothetical protein